METPAQAPLVPIFLGDGRGLVVVPSPTLPLLLSPQQYNELPVVVAHVWRLPVATPPQAPLVPIFFGDSRLSRVLSPICPKSLPPQQYKEFPVVTAHEWLWPADTLAQAPAVPILTGDNRSEVVPSPTCPDSFKPQQYNDLSALIAHVCWEPADTLDHGPLAACAGEATLTSDPNTATAAAARIRRIN